MKKHDRMNTSVIKYIFIQFIQMSLINSNIEQMKMKFKSELNSHKNYKFLLFISIHTKPYADPSAEYNTQKLEAEKNGICHATIKLE